MSRKQMSLFTLIALIPYCIAARKARPKQTWSCLLVMLPLVFAMGFVSQAYGQSYLEVEPNNTCSSAQDLRSALLPLQVQGYKTQPYGDAVDFYRFSATPGTQWRVTLDGDVSKPNPLTGYGVGFFTSDCPNFPSASAFTIYSPAHLDLTVPSNGIFIIGVTACCDGNFSGSGTIEGAYVLSIARASSPTVVTGRVVDADTGAGLPSDQPPFASITLEQCVDYGYGGYCYPLISTPTEPPGDFRFSGDFAGNFRIRVNADPFLYEQPVLSPTGPTGYESVLIMGGTSYDFGVIPLVPIIPVASISGQVTDAVTGHPLAGTVEPFAWVQLFRSSPVGFEYVAEIPTSETGNYMFSSAVVGHPLLHGDYRVVGYANQYQAVNNSLTLVNVQAREARVAPALPLLSNPVRITDVTPCDNIPAQGGRCDFSFRVTAGTADRTEGVAWSLVKAWGTGGLVNATDFLACEQPLSLIPGTHAASAVVRCQFTVPASVPEYAYLCPDARFGEDSRATPHFTVQGLIDPLFCMTKLPGQGSFKVLPQPAAVDLIRHKGEHR